MQSDINIIVDMNIKNDMNINIHIDINMNIDITPPAPPHTMLGPPAEGPGGGAWGGGGVV